MCLSHGSPCDLPWGPDQRGADAGCVPFNLQNGELNKPLFYCKVACPRYLVMVMENELIPVLYSGKWGQKRSSECSSVRKAHLAIVGFHDGRGVREGSQVGSGG